MTEEDKYKFLDELAQTTIRIGDIKSQSEQAMSYMMEVGNLIARIWDDGYAARKEEEKATIPKVCLDCQLLGKTLNKN